MTDVHDDDIVDLQVRHLSIVVALMVVVGVGVLVLLGNTRLGASVSLVYPTALLGATGGTATMARRILRLRDAPAIVRAAVPRRMAVAQVYVSPVVGATFAAVVYAVFLAGLLQGDLFPTFACASDPFEDFGTFATCNPATNADVAMALVWGFVAGFAEHWVPNVLDGFLPRRSPDDPDGSGA